MITITKEQLIASAHARIEFAEMMLAGELEPLKERTWSIELELARIALASLEAEAVAYTEKCEITNMQATGLYLRGFPDNSQGRDIALYTALPAPVSVPDELKEFLRLVECMLVDYRESNLGNAREWIRHISSASDAFEDAHSLSPWLWVRTGRRAAVPPCFRLRLATLR